VLLPPSLREWLPANQLAWFVIDAVESMDLAGFYAIYRTDGHGRAAHEPSMMVALLLYCYAIGERSSRRIERRCIDDIAVRVICANRAPDHTTIARFRQRHEGALAGLFGEILALCAQAGLVGDRGGGHRRHQGGGYTSQHANVDYEQLAKKILEEAAEIDAAEEKVRLEPVRLSPPPVFEPSIAHDERPGNGPFCSGAVPGVRTSPGMLAPAHGVGRDRQRLRRGWCRCG
jgi:transposase